MVVESLMNLRSEVRNQNVLQNSQLLVLYSATTWCVSNVSKDKMHRILFPFSCIFMDQRL